MASKLNGKNGEIRILSPHEISGADATAGR